MKQIVAVALVAAAIVFASAGSSQARPSGGHVSAGGQAGARVEAHRGFQGQPAFQGRQGFEGHREFHQGGRGRVFVGVAPLFVGPAYAYDPGDVDSPPAYSAPAPPAYWYCPSAGAYYPDVPSCPEPWVPV